MRRVLQFSSCSPQGPYRAQRVTPAPSPDAATPWEGECLLTPRGEDGVGEHLGLIEHPVRIFNSMGYPVFCKLQVNQSF
jgi:hypothetical protein